MCMRVRELISVEYTHQSGELQKNFTTQKAGYQKW